MGPGVVGRDHQRHARPVACPGRRETVGAPLLNSTTRPGDGVAALRNRSVVPGSHRRESTRSDRVGHGMGAATPTATVSSQGRRWRPRGCPVDSAGYTRFCPGWRRPGGCGAAISSRVWVVPSSPCRVRSTACGRPMLAESPCSPPPTQPTHTVRFAMAGEPRRPAGASPCRGGRGAARWVAGGVRRAGWSQSGHLRRRVGAGRRGAGGPGRRRVPPPTTVDGRPAAETPLGDALRAAGFATAVRGLAWRGERLREVDGPVPEGDVIARAAKRLQDRISGASR